MKPFTLLAALILAVVAVVHLLRYFQGWEVTANGYVVPVWWSLPGFFIAGVLALLVWWEGTRGSGSRA
jgi:hypothetical protein